MTATITSAELHSSPPPILSARNSIAMPNTTPTQKMVRPMITMAPRIEVEPIYTALKASIGENWPLYKATVAEFVLGKRNQAEVAWIIDPFLRGDQQRESLHNQLIMALFANAQRDPPETPGVASWVAANDKPTTPSKPVTGDAAEQKLKSEIMHMPARERYRIKHLPENQTDNFVTSMALEAQSLSIKLPDPQALSAGGYTRTNWEPEIRKRYQPQLFVESNEFPDEEAISARMLPICYEEGLFNGFAGNAAEYVNLAAEILIKNLLTRCFTMTRENAPRGINWVRTAAYKRRLSHEEEAFERGAVRKSATGLLPAEQDEMRKRRPISLVDLRLCIDMGGTILGHTTPKSMMIFEALGIDDERQPSTKRDVEMIDAPNGILNLDPHARPLANGALNLDPHARPVANGALTNGVHHPVEEEEIPGYSATDQMELDTLFDDCLAGH
ncbi:hypothetical protein BT63DRAFT_453363 [Microthyrium microscopicum]|uniref:Transcriptional co-activator n=1 Tax=Microthyrium microscopicum TaxID=703497 RepID=A0A6A6UHF6_9PEZI|nr:hypothetical protein BT63DRAFT_453363 [Microthyrium microscopicum]